MTSMTMYHFSILLTDGRQFGKGVDVFSSDEHVRGVMGPLWV
jgi:gamma-glutamyl phosphate reductase